MISLEECMKKGLIVKAPGSDALVRGSMEKARELLAEAREDLERGALNSATVIGYAAAFSAARALVFNKGFREKGHACVARFVESHYPDFPEREIDLLDRYRSERHGVLYEVRRSAGAEDAREMVEFGEGFLKQAEKALARGKK